MLLVYKKEKYVRKNRCPQTDGRRFRGGRNQLGLRDLSQWVVSEDPSRRDDKGKPVVVHRLRTDIPVIPNMLIEDATVARKTFYDSKGRPVNYRLVIGWPNTVAGEVTIFQEKPEEEKTLDEKGKVVGYAWGQPNTTAEGAYDDIRYIGYSDDPSVSK